MRFEFTEDALLLQQTVRDFLAKECPPERVRALWETESGRDRALWRQLAELGVAGLCVPEAQQGLGLDETSSVLVLEEIGRAALAEPVVSTAAVGAPLLAELGSDLARSWLERVVGGDAVLAMGQEVNPFVADAHVADLLLLGLADEVHAVPRDEVELTPQPANDPARRIFTVRWSPGKATCVASGREGRALLAAARDRGALACAAQQIGVADRLIEMAVAHAEQREQFGRPIGSFQAVKHMLANAKVALEYARPVVQHAAWSVARAEERRGLHVSMAKLAADRAAQGAARTALQVHGAIGYTWEHDLHLWMRRAWSLAHAWGEAPWHRARVGERILVAGAPIGPGSSFEGDA